MFVKGTGCTDCIDLFPGCKDCDGLGKNCNTCLTDHYLTKIKDNNGTHWGCEDCKGWNEACEECSDTGCTKCKKGYWKANSIGVGCI